MPRKNQGKAIQQMRRRQDLQTTLTIWSQHRRRTLGQSLQERRSQTLLCRHHRHLQQHHHPHLVCPQDLSLWLTEGTRWVIMECNEIFIVRFQVGPHPRKEKKKLPQIETRETQYSPVVGNSQQDWMASLFPGLCLPAWEVWIRVRIPVNGEGGPCGDAGGAGLFRNNSKGLHSLAHC